jgi:5-methylcytosine-specific restriction endonuclease McrA
MTVSAGETHMADHRSPEAARYRRWYGLAAWARAREAQRAKQPLCERCQAKGFIVPMDAVNHRTPHKGDWALFIDSENHQSVCAECHDGPIQSQERSGRANGRVGYRSAVDATGLPTDPRHPFNRG